MSCENYAKLSPAKFGFAWGVIYALGILLVGWTAWLWNYGTDFVNGLASIYLGYAATFWGAILGAIWAFIDFFIFGWLVAVVYNCSCPRSKKKTSESSI